MSISGRLAALGIESEAVREWVADSTGPLGERMYVSHVTTADAAIESLLDEVEQLRCCGNCGHEDEEVLSDTPCGLCRPVREQHSRPSHWIARGGVSVSYEIDTLMGGTVELESEKQCAQERQTIASQFMSELEGVRLLAAKVSEEASERLASVMLEPSMVGPEIEVEKTSEAWPPLFNEGRSKVDDIEASLRRISAFLRAAEL